jgi:hypothetical protein
VRAALGGRDGWVAAAVAAADAMRELNDWARAAAPVLADAFAPRALAALPDVLAAEAARRWLTGRGVPRDELSPGVLDRLIEMARDAATPPRQQFPGGLTVARGKGTISAFH